MKEGQNSVSSLFCRQDGKGFGTEAWFESILVPQKHDFWTDIREKQKSRSGHVIVMDAIHRYWGFCTENCEVRNPKGKNLSSRTLLWGRESKKKRRVYRKMIVRQLAQRLGSRSVRPAQKPSDLPSLTFSCQMTSTGSSTNAYLTCRQRAKDARRETLIGKSKAEKQTG